MKAMNESSIKVYNKKQQKIVDKMNKNSKKWHDADNKFEKDRLHQANVELAEKLGGTILYDSYTGTWSGNAAHIDLGAWMAEWVDNDESEEMMCKCSKCGYPVSYFWGKTGFCPGCGKAMTPEARAMLEKRLRGF